MAETDTITYREMSLEDYPQVIRLWESSEGIGLSEADSPENISAYLKRNPGLSLVAETGGQIIGAVLAGHDGRRGYLHHLAVAPEYRRLGIGRQLEKQVEKTLMDAGIRKIHIFVFESNAEGRRFWSRCGWKYRDSLGIMSREIG